MVAPVDFVERLLGRVGSRSRRMAGGIAHHLHHMEEEAGRKLGRSGFIAADVVLSLLAFLLLIGALLVFILCFETWAVDSPTGFLIWSQKWWGL